MESNAQRIRALAFTVAIVAGVAVAMLAQGGSNKIEICHYPPGNPDNPQTIMISENAWDAHAAHGDQMGDCDACTIDCDDGNQCTQDIVTQECTCDYVPEPFDTPCVFDNGAIGLCGHAVPPGSCGCAFIDPLC